MKKTSLIIATSVIMVATGAAKAQTSSDFSISKSEVGAESLNSYKEERLEALPYIQAYQAEDGTLLKAADATGWGVELFGGAGYMPTEGTFTPELGVSGRYDAKKVSYRLSASALRRVYNAESISPGRGYYSYSADAAVHAVLLRDKYCVNVMSIYISGGYVYGRHRYLLEIEDADGTWNTVVKHNGSGLSIGAGIEYSHRFFATGNTLLIRAGYKTLPNTYVNKTRIEGLVYISLGFNFGCSRSRVK